MKWFCITIYFIFGWLIPYILWKYYTGGYKITHSTKKINSKTRKYPYITINFKPKNKQKSWWYPNYDWYPYAKINEEQFKILYISISIWCIICLILFYNFCDTNTPWISLPID